MPIVYMSFWSMAMILMFASWRLRHWSQVIVLSLITAAILLFTYTLFNELSFLAGVNPSGPLDLPGDYLYKGLYGWLALLVMPFGWLGPIIGLRLAEKVSWSEVVPEAA